MSTRTSALQRALERLSKKFSPDTMLVELGKIYEKNMAESVEDAEYDYWEKCAKAVLNLASGMHKWGTELLDELEDEKEEDDEEE